MAAPHSLSAKVARVEDDALDWPPLSPDAIRWVIVIAGGVFAACVGALLGGAMSI